MSLWLYDDDLARSAERILAGDQAEKLRVLESFHSEVGTLVNHGQQDNSSRIDMLQRRVRCAIRGMHPDQAFEHRD